MKKLEQACSICEGRSEDPCVICGHSRTNKNIDIKKTAQMSYYSETNAKVKKFNMETVGSSEIDRKLREQREWEINKIVDRRIIFRWSVKRIAQAESIPEKLVNEILARHGYPQKVRY